TYRKYRCSTWLAMATGPGLPQRLWQASDLLLRRRRARLRGGIDKQRLNVEVFVLDALGHKEYTDERDNGDDHAVGGNGHRGVVGGVEDFCKHRSESTADNRADGVADGYSGQAHLDGEHFGKERAHRAVGGAE